MAEGITIQQAIDLGQATLNLFEQDALQMTLKHQTYGVLNQWFKTDKMQVEGGVRVEKHISLRDVGNASHVRMYETDTPNIANVDESIKVEWTHAQTSFSYSTKEIAMNMGSKTRIYNLMKQRRDNMYREFADLLEEAAWKTPASASDDRSPIGIPGWLCQGTENSTGGFTGYTPSYWAAASSTFNAGGLACSASSNNRWANYYADHQNKLDDTLLKKLRRAIRLTKFQTPTFAGQAIDPESSFSKFRLYTTSNMLDALEEIATKSDDNIGADLGKYAGAVIFKGIPLTYVDSLDDDANNATQQGYVYGGDPIIGVNHNHFYPVVLDGENFKINKPMSKVGQHNVLTVYLDLTYAYVCDNRRTGGFLISDYQNAG